MTWSNLMLEMRDTPYNKKTVFVFDKLFSESITMEIANLREFLNLLGIR